MGWKRTTHPSLGYPRPPPYRWQVALPQRPLPFPAAIGYLDVMQSPTLTQISRVGRIECLKCTTFGVIIGYLIFAWLNSDVNWSYGLTWIFQIDFAVNVLVGIAGMYLAAYFLGPLAAFLIYRRMNAAFTGFFTGTLVLLSGIITGSAVGFFAEGLSGNDFPNAFLDYVVKPLCWISAFGFFPNIGVGIWFGHTVKEKLASPHINQIQRK